MPADRLRTLVPAGVLIQEFEGTSWVGVVPFRMEGVMLRGLPDLPGISAFPELNLRLYVEVDGKPGVWFISLDAANSLAVWAARRFFHLPYHRARMTVVHDAGRIRYRSERHSRERRVGFQAAYRPTGSVFEARPGTIEYFLTARYCLYTRDRNGSLVRANIHHQPWPLQVAEAAIDENTIASAQGIEVRGPPPLLHFSQRLDVVVWPPEKCG